MTDIADVDFDFLYHVGWGVDESGEITGYIFPDYLSTKQLTEHGIGMAWKRCFPTRSDAVQSLQNEFNCDKIEFIDEQRG
jgi:hypothetical protein